MGFRFSKRVKIAKGVTLNLSKSGLGLSTGVKGFHVSTGPRGTYSTASLPGTGMSWRTKLDKSPSSSNHSAGIQPRSPAASLPFEVHMDENSGEIRIVDKNDVMVNDTDARRIKRTDSYKQAVKELNEKFIEHHLNNTTEVTDIYKATPSIIDEAFLTAQLSELQPTEYKKEDFSIPHPSEDDCKKIIIDRAGILRQAWWKRFPKSLDNYLPKCMPQVLAEEAGKWAKQKEGFDENEEKRRQEIEKNNADNQKEMEILNKRLDGTPSFIIETAVKMMEEITLPVDFSADIHYDESKNTLYLDLDLPEIETLPDKKATELSTGKVKLKDKTQKELKYDYAKCVTGMAYYLAGICFNISPKIQKIMVSGYTQRDSKKTGNIDNEYVYSVLFDRIQFSALNVKEIDPINIIPKFESRMNVTATFEMKTIEPIQV